MQYKPVEKGFEDALAIKNEYDQRPPDKRTFKRKCYVIYNIFVSLFLTPTLPVCMWRGTWSLMDLYNEYFPPIPACLTGQIIIMMLEYWKRYYGNMLVPLKTDTNCDIIFKSIANDIFNHVYNIAAVMFWRILWECLNDNGSPELGPAVIVALVCLGLLILMRSVRNLIAPPIVVVTDQKEFAFDFPTRFRVDGTREPGLYILDCLFSVLVIGSLVVFVWRGLWVLLDLRLFPDNHVTSAWASLIIGYIIVGVTFLLQPLMKWACERLDGFKRVLVADIFLFSSFVGTVNVWRGVWQLLDIYFIPENKFLSDWLSHGLSLILLILLNCSNSVLVRGVYIDAEEPDGQCVVFPVYYIRLFFQKERTKKEQRMRDKLDKIEKNNAVLTDKPITMNHSSEPVTQNTISKNKLDPEEVPIAKQTDNDNLPEIHFVNDVSKNNNNNNNNNNTEPIDSSTTKM